MNKIKQTIKVLCLAVVALILGVSVANAETDDTIELAAGTYFVSSDETEVNGTTVFGDVVDAYNATANDDTAQIIVRNGYYQRTAEKPLVIDRPITIRSESGNADDVHFYGFEQKNANTDAAFVLKHADAKLCGITIRGCKMTKWGDSFSPALLIYSGLAENCVISNNLFSTAGVAVAMHGGALKNSIVSFNKTATKNGGAERQGSGISLVGGGLVEGCKIFSNSSKLQAGIYLSHADSVVRNCEIYNNESFQDQLFDRDKLTAIRYGGGVYIDNAGGLVENCVISNNISAKYAGLYAKNGTVRNCLIKANKAICGDGAGLFIESGATYAYNNTIIDNKQMYGKGSQLYMTNNAKADNLVVAVSCGDCNISDAVVVTGGASVSYSALPLEMGDNNIVSVRSEFDERGCPYYGTAYLSSGTDLSMLITKDINGADRQAGTFGMGAYSVLDGTFALSADEVYVKKGARVKFTIHSESMPNGIVWDFKDGSNATALDGDGTHTFSECGNFDVTVSANNGTHAASVTVKVLPVKTYAKEGNVGIWPYDEESKASPNIQDAIDAVYSSMECQGVVEVLPGIYKDQEGASTEIFAPMVLVDRNVMVKARDEHAAVLDAEGKRLVASVAYKDAVLSGFVLENGKTAFADGYRFGSSASLIQFDGVTTNCIMRNGTGNRNGLVSVYSGTIADCVVSNGTTTSTGTDSPCGGLTIFGPAKVVGTLIAKNKGGQGYGLYLMAGASGAVVKNCIISENSEYGSWANRGGGVCLEAGLLEASLVISNKTPHSGGGVYLKNGTLRNCIIKDNDAVGSYPGADVDEGFGGGVYLENGNLINCNILDNKALNSYAGIYQKSGTAVNNILCDNVVTSSGEYLDFGGAKTNITYSAFKAYTDQMLIPAQEGNIAIADPGFQRRKGFAYYLSNGSPCIDKGDNSEDNYWLTQDSALDYTGAKRVVHKIVDIGASEKQFNKGTVIILQ